MSRREYYIDNQPEILPEPSNLVHLIAIYIRNQTTQSNAGYKTPINWNNNMYQIGNKESTETYKFLYTPFQDIWTAGSAVYNRLYFFMADFRWALNQDEAKFKYKAASYTTGLIPGKMMILNNYKLPEWDAALNNNAFGPNSTGSYRTVTANDPGVTDLFDHVQAYLNAGGYYETIPGTDAYQLEFNMKYAMQWNMNEGASLHSGLGNEDYALICVFADSANWFSVQNYKNVPTINGSRTQTIVDVTGFYVDGVKI